MGGFTVAGLITVPDVGAGRVPGTVGRSGVSRYNRARASVVVLVASGGVRGSSGGWFHRAADDTLIVKVINISVWRELSSGSVGLNTVPSFLLLTAAVIPEEIRAATRVFAVIPEELRAATRVLAILVGGFADEPAATAEGLEAAPPGGTPTGNRGRGNSRLMERQVIPIYPVTASTGVGSGEITGACSRADHSVFSPRSLVIKSEGELDELVGIPIDINRSECIVVTAPKPSNKAILGYQGPVLSVCVLVRRMRAVLGACFGDEVALL